MGQRHRKRRGGGEFGRGRRDGNRGNFNPPRGALRSVLDNLNPLLPDQESNRRNKKDKSYSKGHQIGQRDRSDRERRGGKCFLTTACTVSANLPDTCDELMTLRDFRDGYLSRTRAGRQGIRHYYQIAPKIVDAINSSDGCEIEWARVLTEVRRAVRFISTREYEAAANVYKTMVLDLENRYLKS